MKYTISALSKKTGLSIHTLRFYEKEGILRHVERTDTGRRVYGEASLGCIIAVICLKEAGLTLPQIKDFFDSTLKGAETLPERMEMLRTARKNLMKQRESIDRSMQFVDFAISYGQGALLAAESGQNHEENFPFLTLEGITNFPYIKMMDGKLAAYVPEEEERLSAKKEKLNKQK